MTGFKCIEVGYIGMFSRKDKKGNGGKRGLHLFYRPDYCDGTLEAMEAVRRKIADGYVPPDDRIVSRNERRRADIRYRPDEEPRYLEGRETMARHGFDLCELDYVIDTLCRGYRLPPNYRNHKFKGDMRGFMECHVGSDRVLVYGYDRDNLILHAIDTGSHKDIFRRWPYQPTPAFRIRSIRAPGR